MFEVTAVGRLGRDPEPRTVQGPNGPSQVVDLSIKFDGLNLKFPDKKKVESWSSISIWDERDQKWLLQYAKKGSMLTVTGTPEIEVYHSSTNNRSEAKLTFSGPRVKFFNSGNKQNNQSQGSNQNQNQNNRQVQNQNQQTEQQKPSTSPFENPNSNGQNGSAFEEMFGGLNNLIIK